MALPNGSGGFQIGDGNTSDPIFRVVPAPATATSTATCAAPGLPLGILQCAIDQASCVHNRPDVLYRCQHRVCPDAR